MQYAHLYFLYLPLTVLVFIITYFGFFHLVGVDFYVDHGEITYQDVLVGTNRIEVSSIRSPRWGFLGETYAEIVRFDGLYRYEKI